MQQPCPRCRFISDRPTRFCRQCGIALFTETVTTSAPTQNYPHQPDQPYSTARLRPVAQVQAPTEETLRFYQPPVGAAAPRRKSRAGIWILIALISLLLAGGGMVAMVSSALRSRSQAVRPSLTEDLGERIEKHIQRALQEAEKTRRAVREAVPPSPPPPPGRAPGTALEKYKYPNATFDSMSSIPGGQMLNMQTRDALSQVRDFYQKLLGDPLIEHQGREKNLIFQSSEDPSLVVVVQGARTDPEGLQILVVHSLIPLPKMQ